MLGQISFVGVVALDELLSAGSERGSGATVGDTIAGGGHDPVEAFESEEMRQVLADAINRMPDRERLVLTLYYYEGLTLAEIGNVLGVTESRVCQIHTKAIFRLVPRRRSRSPNAASSRRPGPSSTRAWPAAAAHESSSLLERGATRRVRHQNQTAIEPGNSAWNR